MEQFKEQRHNRSVTIVPKKQRFTGSIDIRGVCFGYYKSLPLHPLKSIPDFTAIWNALRAEGALLIYLFEDNSVGCWWKESSLCQQRACSSDFGGAMLSLGNVRASSLLKFAGLDPRPSLNTKQLSVQHEATEESQQAFLFILKLISTLPAWVDSHLSLNLVQWNKHQLLSWKKFPLSKQAVKHTNKSGSNTTTYTLIQFNQKNGYVPQHRGYPPRAYHHIQALNQK